MILHLLIDFIAYFDAEVNGSWRHWTIHIGRVPLNTGIKIGLKRIEYILYSAKNLKSSAIKFYVILDFTPQIKKRIRLS